MASGPVQAEEEGFRNPKVVHAAGFHESWEGHSQPPRQKHDEQLPATRGRAFRIDLCRDSETLMKLRMPASLGAAMPVAFFDQGR